VLRNAQMREGEVLLYSVNYVCKYMHIYMYVNYTSSGSNNKVKSVPLGAKR
jgi:hypothetical protein